MALFAQRKEILVTQRIPQVDKILRHEALVGVQQHFRRDLLTEIVRQVLSEVRAAESSEADIDSIIGTVLQRVQTLTTPSLRKVINGTGVVLNTNLGRAPISPAALSQLEEIGSGYCNLEIDLKTGKRGKRSERIQELLRLLTGAEAAIVVNNNAAAVLLAVNALAKGKEVIVSRGELIEIGGSFRLPDVIDAAGGTLKEVGTTNRTRVADFRKALSERSGLMMRCHRSNFEITGFTEEVSLGELVQLSAEASTPLLEDLGSGVLFDLQVAGLKNEPTVRAVVATGCDLVSFSGDKLLGGPQAGFIVGKKAWVEKLAKHSLYRALRLDKLTLALLERTLIAYLSPTPEEAIPVINMLRATTEELTTRAMSLCSTISGASHVSCEVVRTNAAAGGGSLPGDSIESVGLKIKVEGLKPNKVSELLRSSEPPVIAIVQNDELLIDLRTVARQDDGLLSTLIKNLGSRK